MSEPTTSDVLREAAQILMREGWGQGVYGWDRDGSRCALGAVKKVAETRGLHRRIVLEARKVLGASIGVRSVADWNDDPSRTAENVILALKQCAADLEAGAA